MLAPPQAFSQSIQKLVGLIFQDLRHLKSLIFGFLFAEPMMSAACAVVLPFSCTRGASPWRINYAEIFPNGDRWMHAVPWLDVEIKKEGETHQGSYKM